MDWKEFRRFLLETVIILFPVVVVMISQWVSNSPLEAQEFIVAAFALASTTTLQLLYALWDKTVSNRGVISFWLALTIVLSMTMMNVLGSLSIESEDTQVMIAVPWWWGGIAFVITLVFVFYAQDDLVREKHHMEAMP